MRNLSGVFCGTAVAVAVASLASQTSPPTQAGAPAAAGIDFASIDRNIRPQDNFYRFANGAWLARAEISADQTSDSLASAAANTADAAVRSLIEEAAASELVKPGTDLQKIRDLYRSRMDTATIDRLGMKPIQPELARIAALTDRGELAELFAHLARIGVRTPVEFSVGRDEKDATRYIAYASQSGIGLPDRENYLRKDANFEKVRAAYRTYVAALLRAAEQPEPEKAAENIIAFETQLAEKQWDRARTRDREATYTFKTVKELETFTRTFSWSRYLEAAGAKKTPGVVLRQPDYFQALDAILAETPLAMLKQYLVFAVLDDTWSSLSQPFRSAGFAFRGQVMLGRKEPPPVVSTAVAAVKSYLGDAVGRIYVERHFPPERKARMQQLVSNISATFRESIDDVDWMSPATKARAKEKLARFNVEIGYPEQWKDYSALEIRADDLVGNTRRARNWWWNDMVGRLGRPPNRSLWTRTTTPLTVNAGYSATTNGIILPAAILQPPLFDLHADDAVNYGRMGGLVGHEISHGFDDRGSQSDGDGNMRDWWSEQERRAFNERARPLIGQYGEFEPLPGQRINGELTFAENLADLTGWSMAYRAYRRSLKGGSAPVIGGFTGDQRFFLALAQMRRSKQRDEVLQRILLTDNHSPMEYRVNGALRNMSEFYAAFGVQPADAMFLPPERRVKVW